MTIRIRYFIVLIIWSPLLMIGQNSGFLDSLTHQLNSAPQSERPHILNLLAWELKYSDPQQAKIYAEEAARLSADSDDAVNQAFAWRNLGALFFLTGNFNEARAELQKAINLATTVKARYQLAKALNLMGLIEREKLNYKEALEYFRQARDIYVEINDDEEVTGLLHNLAFLYSEMNEKAEALKIYHEVLEDENKRGNQYGIGRTANNLGYLYLDLEKYELAKQYFNLATEKSLATGNKNFEASAYHGLASVEKQLDNPDQSFRLFKKAIVINKETGNHFWLANNYSSISTLLFSIGRNNDGLAFADSAIAIYDQIGLVQEKYDVLSAIGQYYLETDELSKAESIYERMLAIADSLEPIDGLYALWGLYTINRRQNNPETAIVFLENYMVLSDSLESLEKEKLLMEVETQYELKRMQNENDHLKAENLLKKKVILNQKIVFALSVFIILVLIVVSILLNRGRRKLKQAHNQLKAKNREVEDKSAQLQASNASKDKIFSIIAHDLRNPFNSLVGLSDMLLTEVETYNDELLTEYADMINRSARNGHSLLENLLQWSHSQRGTIRFTPSKLELHTLVAKLLKIYLSSAEEKGLSLINAIPEHSFAWADPDMLATILRNLIDNAIKFSNEQGEVVISAEYSGQVVELCVADNGVGIEAERITGLFEPSHRTTRGTRDENGSGLGLILCREFVEQHEGTIHVESEPGSGSRFCFTLPLKSVSQVREAIKRESVS